VSSTAGSTPQETLPVRSVDHSRLRRLSANSALLRTRRTASESNTSTLRTSATTVDRPGPDRNGRRRSAVGPDLSARISTLHRYPTSGLIAPGASGTRIRRTARCAFSTRSGEFPTSRNTRIVSLETLHGRVDQLSEVGTVQDVCLRHEASPTPSNRLTARTQRTPHRCLRRRAVPLGSQVRRHRQMAGHLRIQAPLIRG
jgi:hypothetical protein